MFIPIICGMNNYDSNYKPKLQSTKKKNGEQPIDLPPLQPSDYENLYCPNCHNYSARPIKRRQFFTVWFIPILPVYWGKQVKCTICNWRQDFKDEAQLRKIVNEQKNIRNNQPQTYQAQQPPQMYQAQPTTQAPVNQQPPQTYQQLYS
ncbi:hypothetical protein TPHA_0A03800 [Tetrapisispora phaffii CBS 4417]|uniref:Zinc-ribbon 15 domain-containing protein n=1 Tax=Tetrapisispora phaffii (strain ATCC 24235 / CBS 4417 / NBRC 1672 / NRRL Y-8282 / UCD 70-5) TaxID=1071381 RepID=G8BNH8_TETPH|nr:hypothetical protein TPHA_0A03800 [Tetrapisispora phaffii CBS 4417]CCE61456.1 hypothetical protein TPHA_0A03800 [Tetrapisispora phaffii CBS 4417]